MTFVDYLVKLLEPYSDKPEFTTCVMKAMEKLGHKVANRDPAMFEPHGIKCNT